jgi:hypothetical protein
MERKGRLDTFGTDRHDDGVAGVVPARESCADVDIGRQDVHELSLAFVAPLRSEDHGHWRRRSDHGPLISILRADADKLISAEWERVGLPLMVVFVVRARCWQKYNL